MDVILEHAWLYTKPKPRRGLLRLACIISHHKDMKHESQN